MSSPVIFLDCVPSNKVIVKKNTTIVDATALSFILDIDFVDFYVKKYKTDISLSESNGFNDINI